MSKSKDKSWIKGIFLLISGMFLGVTICWVVCSSSRKDENWDIEPLFSDDSIFMFAEIRNFLDNVESTGNLFFSRAEMGNLREMRAHLSAAEVYFTVNRHLRSLPVGQRKAFLEKYQEWAEEYRKKCDFAERMESGECPLDGGEISIIISNSFEDEFLQKYLLQFRKPVVTMFDRELFPNSQIYQIIDLKSGKIVGESYVNHDTRTQLTFFYPFAIPQERRKKVLAFLREINPEFNIDSEGRCTFSQWGNSMSDGGLFKLYPELQRLMDKNCRVEECLENVRKYPLSKRRNIEIIDMKPFEVK